jgi:cell envelope-related function transcriptional attenuator common domain
MNKNKSRSMDGFMPRKRSSNLIDPTVKKLKPKSAPLHDSRLVVDNPKRRSEMMITEEISIDETELRHDKKRRGKDKKVKIKNNKLKKKHPVRRAIGIILLLAGLGVIGFIVYIGFIVANTSNSIFEGGVAGYLKKDKLKVDSNGRTNILIFGTAEDDEGGTHDGGNLTDSLMVVSIHQEEKTVSMVSIPRDLWITYEGPCTVGYYGRINAQYTCASNDGKDEKAGAKALQKKISEVTGISIQYYVHLNFTAFVDAIDAVGGVSIVIESEDSRGIWDPNFNWKCNHTCEMVQYPNGPTGLMDGEHALALARSRNAAGGYGLPGSNFDREKNQQKIIKALFEKVTTAGTLTDINKVTKILDSLGNNLRTSVNTSEVRTFLEVGTSIKSADITSIDLRDSEEPMLTTGMVGDQSVVIPIAGNLNFSDVISFIKKKLSSNSVIQEAARVAVYNASDITGLASKVSDKLFDNDINVTVVANTDHKPSDKLVVYAVSSKKPATRRKIESLYGVTAKPASKLPSAFSGVNVDFVVIISSEDALND